MSESTPQIINYSEELQTILDQYGYSCKEAAQEAADLWAIEINDHGAIIHYTTETLINERCIVAKIHFARTLKNYWLIGISAEMAWTGRGYKPSVWNREGYFDYEVAKKEGIKQLKEFFQRNASANEMSLIRALLATHDHVQLTLF